MTTLREAAQAIIYYSTTGAPDFPEWEAKYEALRAALAAEPPDPTASKDHDLARQDAPPQTPMTGEEISQLWSDVAQNGNSVFYFARAVERHHGIGPARGE
jgi:hypothetical protein